VKVCLVHNSYQQAGGEDTVVAVERELLTRGGDEVVTYTADNAAITGMDRLTLASNTLWNRRIADDLERFLKSERPAIVHFHNTFPLISPAAYYAARRAGVPVVQTLHNFRLICPNALLLRDGAPCESCVGRAIAWPAVAYRCYRESRAASAVTAGMLALHRALGTWRRLVDVYVSCSDFARDKFIAGGLPAERLVVKANSLLDDPGMGTHGGGYVLFVGRLSPEKGVDALLGAWERLAEPPPLHVIGSGPLEGRMRDHPRVRWLGWQSHENVIAMMQKASALIFPSICYEGSFPLTLVESLAVGLPVIASALGSVADVIRHERQGLLVPPGDQAALASAIERVACRPDDLRAMGLAGRAEFEARFTPERNYEALKRIYVRATEHRRSATASGAREAAAC
jgi:glycosyltransferase involved in cell wall biosynthesis